jgi:hypothetical protein
VIYKKNASFSRHEFIHPAAGIPEKSRLGDGCGGLAGFVELPSFYRG